jgi:hypothetical protein
LGVALALALAGQSNRSTCGAPWATVGDNPVCWACAGSDVVNVAMIAIVNCTAIAVIAMTKGTALRRRLGFRNIPNILYC